jgi:ubiquinone/menaquinone biosynthesis C-methylase UbiE
MRLGQRFARLATEAVVRNPRLWRLFREPIRRQFDGLAPEWDSRRSEDAVAPLEAALERIDPPPRDVLDLGTGTGLGAFAIARKFPDADVVGVDLATEMVERARANTPPELEASVRFEVADASRLGYDDGAFDLVTLANMIPFFDELARVLRRGGHVVFSFSAGPETPIYVPPERLQEELGRRGFADFAEIIAGHGSGLVARKG